MVMRFAPCEHPGLPSAANCCVKHSTRVRLTVQGHQSRLAIEFRRPCLRPLRMHLSSLRTTSAHRAISQVLLGAAGQRRGRLHLRPGCCRHQRGRIVTHANSRVSISLGLFDSSASDISCRSTARTFYWILLHLSRTALRQALPIFSARVGLSCLGRLTTARPATPAAGVAPGTRRLVRRARGRLPHLRATRDPECTTPSPSSMPAGRAIADLDHLVPSNARCIALLVRLGKSSACLPVR